MEGGRRKRRSRAHMEKLKSSLKTLQEAIAAMKPIGPICLQDAETQSFRSLAAEVNYPFTSTTTTCSSSGSCSPISFSLGAVIPQEEEYSASAAAAAMPGAPSLNDLLQVKGPISSERFFFSPRTTNSIMEESKPQQQQQPELCKAVSEHSSSLYEESVMLAMSSNDPFRDFRTSMEEMVAAHQLREWRSLQELLNWYLRLNDRENHKVIVLAFVDLLMHLMDQDQQVL